MKGQQNNKVYTIEIPEEELSIHETICDSHYAIVVLNDALLDLDSIQKAVFGWTCRVQIGYINCNEDNFPLHEDREDSSDFIDAISIGLKGNPEHPNGVYIGKIISNGQCDAVWQLNNPELAANYLDRVINSGNYPIGGIEYNIECDPSWNSIQFYFQDFRNQ